MYHQTRCQRTDQFGGITQTSTQLRSYSLPPGNVINYLTGDEAEKAWQVAIPTSIIKPSLNGVLNGVLNGLDEIIENKDNNTSGSKKNPEDVDLGELDGGTEGATASTVSFSTKDCVVQSGDVTMGVEEVVWSPEPVQNVGFSNGDDMILVGKSVNHLGDNTALNTGRST